MPDKLDSIKSTKGFTQLSNNSLNNLPADNIPTIDTDSETPNSFNFTIEEKIILGKKPYIEK